MLSALSNCNWQWSRRWRSEEHTSELQSQSNLVCRLLLEKKKIIRTTSVLVRFVYLVHLSSSLISEIEPLRLAFASRMDLTPLMIVRASAHSALYAMLLTS